MTRSEVGRDDAGHLFADLRLRIVTHYAIHDPGRHAVTFFDYVRQLCSAEPLPGEATEAELRAAVEHHAIVWDEVGPDLKGGGGLVAIEQAADAVVDVAGRYSRTPSQVRTRSCPHESPQIEF